MSDQNEFEYFEPSEAQIAARKRRNYAIGGALIAFTALVFLLMIVKFGGASSGAAGGGTGGLL